MNKSISNIESPCSRNCCLNQENICLGCFRHIDEIIAWQGFSEQDKKQIMSACQQRCKEVLALKSLG
jgi:predicted Fe-S protein YdhL (DUF1289 family)|tara:strand:- start:480 stop:680 length:201 start_codon:yes stop_codon:yes gene_type:complete